MNFNFLKKNIKFSRGFTLVETITAIFIFVIIVGIVVGIFVRSVELQRSSFDAQKIVENSLFLLEAISRDARISEICPIPEPSATATQIRYPSSSDSDWSILVGAPTRHEAVDDPVGFPSDDGSSYVGTTSDTNQDFDFQNFDLTSDGTINSVRVFFRGQKIGGSTNRIRLRLVVSGKNHSAPSYSNMTASWADYSYTWTSNPETGSAWTEAEVEDDPSVSDPLESFRLQSDVSSSQQVQVTQTYIEVSYQTLGIPACSVTSLTLIHPLKGLVIYSWNPASGKLTKTEGGVTADLSSSDINFTRFDFLTTGVGVDDRQPKVTMVMSAQNRYGRPVKFDLQTSITTRNVEDEFKN